MKKILKMQVKPKKPPTIRDDVHLLCLLLLILPVLGVQKCAPGPEPTGALIGNGIVSFSTGAFDGPVFSNIFVPAARVRVFADPAGGGTISLDETRQESDDVNIPIDPKFGQVLKVRFSNARTADKIVVVASKAVLVYEIVADKFKDPMIFTPAGQATDFKLDADDNVYYTATTSSSSTGLFFLKRNPDGTYQPPVAVQTGANPVAVAVSDPDATGKGMLATANNGDNTTTVCDRASDGTPQNCTDMPAGPAGAKPVDVRLEFIRQLLARPDIAVITTRFDDSGKELPGNLRVLHSDGSGGSDYATGVGPSALTSGRLLATGTAPPDLIVANARDNTFSVFRNQGDGTFLPKLDYPAGLNPFQLQVVDANNDGKPDIDVTGANGQFLSPGNGDSTFPRPFVNNVDQGPVSLAAGDFNGDGKTDLISINSTAGSISVLLGNGDGTYQAAQNIAVGNSPSFAAVADFNGDGKLDLAINASISSPPFNSVVILLGNGDGTFQVSQNLGAGFSATALTSADFNGDGHPDLAIYDLVRDKLLVAFGNGDGTFQNPVAQAATVEGFGRYMIAGDFNRDGKMDLAVATQKFLPDQSRIGTVSVLLGNGDGTFQNSVAYQVGASFTSSAPVWLAMGDFNHDGNLDLVAANNGASNQSEVSVLLGNGDGTFQTAVDYPASGLLPFGASNIAANSVAVADMDGDGNDDLVVGNAISSFGGPQQGSLGLVSFVKGKGDGTFFPSVDLASGRGATGVIVGEFNHDGGMDAATANTTDNSISVLLSPPVIAFSDDQLTFASQNVGQPAATQMLVVENPAAVPLKISSITINGNGFSETHDCTDTIPVGGFCTVKIGFTATTAGTSTGTLSFTDNATNGIPQIIQLNGTGGGSTPDTTPPTTAANIMPAPNANGWNNSSVMVTLDSQDNTGGSGVKNITYSSAGAQVLSSTTVNGSSTTFSIANEGVSTISYFGTDNAGNIESAKMLVVKIDETAPSIVGTRMPAPNAAGWNNTAVTVSFACNDLLSGLAAGSPPAPTVLSTEGLGQMVTGSCTDIAGNTASAVVQNLNLDFTSPVLTINANPPANANQWNNTDVVVGFSAVDNLSGVAEVSARVAVSKEGLNQIISGQALDVAGNLTTGSISISIDKTPPEAFDQFDPVNRDAALFGRDSLSGTPPGPVQPISVMPLNVEFSELRTYRVLDLAGNQLLLTEKVRRNHQREEVTLLTLQYAQGPTITLGPNRQVYEWKLNDDGTLRSLKQDYQAGDGPSAMQVEARFSARDNQTVIEQHGPGPEQKTVQPGLALLRLSTSKGALSIEIP